MDKEVNILGYWNGSIEDPEITFNQEEALRSNKTLCIINLKPVPQLSNSENDIDKKLKKVSRELRGFVTTLRKIRP